MDGLRVTPDLRVPDLQVSPALPGLHSALSVIATALGTCFLRQQRESEATVALLGAFHCNVPDDGFLGEAVPSFGALLT